MNHQNDVFVIEKKGIHQRFFKMIALTLARKLRELGSQAKYSDKRLQKETSKDILKVTDRDRTYTERFNLPAQEVVIKG